MPLKAVRGELEALEVAPDGWDEFVEEAPGAVGAGRPPPRAGIDLEADAATDDKPVPPAQGTKEEKNTYIIAVGTRTAQQENVSCEYTGFMFRIHAINL